MSVKLQNDRLKKYKLKRENATLNERITFMDKQIKNKDEALDKLEAKAAKFEGEMHRAENEFNKRIAEY